jgi:hypothetical protein
MGNRAAILAGEKKGKNSAFSATSWSAEWGKVIVEDSVRAEEESGAKAPQNAPLIQGPEGPCSLQKTQGGFVRHCLILAIRDKAALFLMASATNST